MSSEDRDRLKLALAIVSGRREELNAWERYRLGVVCDHAPGTNILRAQAECVIAELIEKALEGKS